NFAGGHYGTVPGGLLNTAAGDYSFAAGNRAKANHQGAFVWADSQIADFVSTAANQFLIRAGGGVGINNNSPAGVLDVTAGGTGGIPHETGIEGLLMSGGNVPGVLCLGNALDVWAKWGGIGAGKAGGRT